MQFLNMIRTIRKHSSVSGGVKYSQGFTLIELLVVIAIIGILSSTIMASLGAARTKARDARRIADFRQVRIALELYYDQYREYPHSCSWGGSHTSKNAPGNWIPELVTAGFMPVLPNDPKDNAFSPWITGQYTYFYLSCSPYQDYNLITQFEVTSNENRCELKCYQFHSDTSTPGRVGQNWCGATSSICDGVGNYSPYLYSDH